MSEHLAVPGVQIDRIQALDHVRSAQRCSLEALIAPPARNLSMVSRKQHIRYATSAPQRRFGVHRVLQQAIFVGLLDKGVCVADDAGNQPRDGLNHDQGRDLPATQDVVTNRDDSHRHHRLSLLDDSLIDALVATAGERQPGLDRQLVGHCLGEPHTTWPRD